MKRILWMMPYFEHFGGAERVTLDITGALAKDFAVTLLLLKPGIIRDYPLGDGVRLETLLDSQARLRWHLPQVIQALVRKARQHDVVVAGLELGPTYISASVALAARRPCIAICHSPLRDYLDSASLPKYHRTLSRWAYRHVHRVVGVGNVVKEHLRTEFRVPAERLCTIYDSVDLARLKRLGEEPSQWLPPAEWFLVGMGRLVKEKGFDVLLEAFAMLAPDNDLHLVILGEGSLRAELEGLVERLGLGGRVHLPGFLQNPYPVLRRAQAFAFPSRYEGFGIAALEAMALGVPFVASDIPSVREITDDGRYALLVPPDDPGALANALMEVLSRPDMRERLASDGPRRAEAFSISRAAEQWRSLIEEVCR